MAKQVSEPLLIDIERIMNDPVLREKSEQIFFQEEKASLPLLEDMRRSTIVTRELLDFQVTI